MKRLPFLLIPAAVIFLTPVVLAQRSMCPFRMNMQLQLQMQMRPQFNMQQQMLQRQMQHMMTQRFNAMPRQMMARPPQMNFGPVRRTAVSFNINRFAMPRTTMVQRNITTVRRTAGMPRFICNAGRRGGIPAQRFTVQRRTMVQRRMTFVTQVRRTANVARITMNRPRMVASAPRRVGVARQNPYVTQVRRTGNPVNRLTQMTRRNDPRLRAQVNVTMTCGRCHNCPVHRGPSITRQPPSMPWLTANRPRMDRPWPGPNRPLPMVQRPMPMPRPIARQPFPGPRPIVRMPQPIPRFIMNPLPPMRVPIFLPPTLPPLTMVRTSPTVPGWMIRQPSPRPVTSPGMERPSTRTPGSDPRPVAVRIQRRGEKPVDLVGTKPFLKSLPGLTSTPPPLAKLDGALADINPLLEQGKLSASSRPAENEPRVLPLSVAQLPPMAPLPGEKNLDRTLLPTLDADDESDLDSGDSASKPLVLETILLAPPLPRLPDMVGP